MKKYTFIVSILFALCCFTALYAYSQNDSIPNSSFEVWIDNPFQDYSEPEYWNTPNPYTSVPFVNVVTVEKDTVDPCSGCCSAMLTTKFVLMGKVPGIMTLGQIEIDIINFTGDITGGIPYKQQPVNLTGYYKYSPAGEDSCLIVANLYRFLPAKGKKESVALATFKTNTDTSEWAFFSVPFQYFNDSILPDSINITILSSSNIEDPKVGSVLHVDDIRLEGFLGIGGNEQEARRIMAYPNPAGDNINLALREIVGNGYLRIFDSGGRQVLSKNVSGKQINVMTGALNSGYYYFYILEKGKKKAYGSFIIKR